MNLARLVFLIKISEINKLNIWVGISVSLKDKKYWLNLIKSANIVTRKVEKVHTAEVLGNTHGR